MGEILRVTCVPLRPIYCRLVQCSRALMSVICVPLKSNTLIPSWKSLRDKRSL